MSSLLGSILRITRLLFMRSHTFEDLRQLLEKRPDARFATANRCDRDFPVPGDYQRDWVDAQAGAAASSRTFPALRLLCPLAFASASAITHRDPANWNDRVTLNLNRVAKNCFR